MNSNYAYEYWRDNHKEISSWTVTDDKCSPHFHSTLEFTYVTSGEITALVNGQSYLLSKDDILIVPSYTIHSYTTESESTSYVFTAPLERIPAYAKLLDSKTFAKNHLQKPGVLPELRHCLDAIIYYSHAKDISVKEHMIQGYTYVLLGLIIESAGLINISDKKTASLAQDILLYLQEYYLKPITLADIASHFGYSSSRFSHIFNEYFGCKLIEYVNNLRCRHALESIRKDSKPINEIALASGFESPRTFYRAFKYCFGSTPKQYLLQMKPWYD